MGATIAIIYFGGFIVSIIVHRSRAGIPFFAKLRIFGDGMFGWIAIHGFKAMFWPINLIVWFLRGRPGPNVVFGAR